MWSSRRSVRSTRSSGIANGWPPASTSSAAMIASVSGRRICAAVPSPSSEVSVTSPPSSRIIVAHRVHADAAAGDVARDLGGREAGREQQLRGARLASSDAAASAAISPRSTAAATDLGRVDAAPVVADVDDDVAAGVAGGDLERAGPRLARRDAVLGRLEAVVERVADEVDERVAERVDDGAVELGVLADELELDLLAELGRQVAHEAREAQEDGLDRDHPDLHDHRLQGLRGARELLHRLAQAGHVGLGGERLDVRAVHDELAHAVHELVEALGVDADGGGGLLRRGGGSGAAGGRRGLGGGLGRRRRAPRPPGPRRRRRRARPPSPWRRRGRP